MEYPRNASGLKYPEKINLRWNSFEANAKVVFREFREEREFQDVTVVAGDGRQIRANKLVLASGSHFFHKILRENPHPHPLICLKGVSFKHLSHLLDFIYNGETDVDKDDLEDFVDIAEDLKVKGLTKEDKTPKTICHLTPAPFQSQGAPEVFTTWPQVSTPHQSEFRESATSQGHAAREEAATLHSRSAHQRGQVAAGKRSPEPTVSCGNNVSLACGPKVTVEVDHNEVDAELKTKSMGQKQNYRAISNGKKLKEEVMDSSSDKDAIDVTTNVFQNKELDEMMLAKEHTKHIDKEEIMDSTCNMFVTGSEDSKQTRYDCYRQNEEDNMIQDEELDAYGEAFSSKVKNLWCSFCNKTFYNASTFRIHERKHTGEKPFECLACPKKYISASNLYKHKRNSHAASCYQCELCYKIFANSTDLKWHKCSEIF